MQKKLTGIDACNIQKVNHQSLPLWELIPVKIILYFVHSPGKRKRVVDDTAVAEITNKLAACDINVSDISLEVRRKFNKHKGKCQGNITVFSKFFNTSHLFTHILVSFGRLLIKVGHETEKNTLVVYLHEV